MVTRAVPVAMLASQVTRRAMRLKRRYARPGDLARHVDVKNRSSPALEVIDDALIALTDPRSEFDALEITLPPQEGKSQRVSRTYASWLLDHNPRLRIAIVSYAEEISLRWGRDIKMDVAQHPCTDSPGTPGACGRACGGLHVTIRQDSRAAGRWQTPEGGGIYCVGIGGPLAGQPVDVLIIDDPVKDRASAESKTVRDSTWDWWESVALTRLAPGARVVMITTRWHEDDLAGRIAARPSPLRWRRLRIPAIADSPDDPLGRAPGVELPSVRGRKPGHFRNLRATMSPYVFAGVYQQSPTAAEGNFFRKASFRYWRWTDPWADGRERILCEGQPVTLQDCWRYVTMDFAASTKSSADYTVASMWAVTPDGHLILLDRERGHVEDHEHYLMAQRLQDAWGHCTIYVEQNWWSKTFTADAVNLGFGIAGMRADTDKVTRAVPAAGRVHAGRVWFPAEAEWLDEWVNELAVFPMGSNDDQVDTLSYAVRVQVSEWTPAREQSPRPGRTAWEQAVSQAHAASTGGGEVDFMNVQY